MSKTAYTYISGSLIKEFKMILDYWDEKKSVKENFSSFSENKILGKETSDYGRSVANYIRKRFYFGDKDHYDTLRYALRRFKEKKLIDYLIYFHLGIIDSTFQHFILEFLYPKYKSKTLHIITSDASNFITKKLDNFNIKSKKGIYNVSIGLLATGKELGILRGKNIKEFLHVYFHDELLAYLLYWMKYQKLSTVEIVKHKGWKFFFKEEIEVEKLLIHAQKLKLIVYNQAGSIRRIDWLYKDIWEVIDHFS